MPQTDLDQLIEAFSRADSIEGIHGACARMCDSYDFDCFFYGARIPVSLVRPQQIVISAYPAAWWSRYREQGYLKSDPAVAHCERSTIPVDWADLARAEAKNTLARRIMTEAGESGLNSGISIPIHGGHGESAIFSLASAQEPSRWVHRRREVMPYLQLLGAHLHEAVRRVIEIREIAPAPVQLTARERECLLWAAEGKTSWETSQILGIAERTVTFHLQNAAEKLNVTNRQQAVARAVAQGLLTPALI